MKRAPNSPTTLTSIIISKKISSKICICSYNKWASRDHDQKSSTGISTPASKLKANKRKTYILPTHERKQPSQPTRSCKITQQYTPTSTPTKHSLNGNQRVQPTKCKQHHRLACPFHYNCLQFNLVSFWKFVHMAKDAIMLALTISLKECICAMNVRIPYITNASYLWCLTSISGARCVSLRFQHFPETSRSSTEKDIEFHSESNHFNSLPYKDNEHNFDSLPSPKKQKQTHNMYMDIGYDIDSNSLPSTRLPSPKTQKQTHNMDTEIGYRRQAAQYLTNRCFLVNQSLLMKMI